MFERWPYTNFHNLNLDWIIDKVKNIDDNVASAQASAESAAESAATASDKAEEASEAAASAAVDASAIPDALEQLATTNARLDTLIVDGTPTEGNTELIDIRTAWDGFSYPTAGDAVRAQAEDNHNDLFNITGAANAVLYNKTGTAARLGNINNWRWFYPVHINPGDVLQSISYYGMAVAGNATVLTEIWSDNGRTLTRVKSVTTTVEAGSPSSLRNVPINYRAGIDRLWVSLTSTDNVVGAFLEQGTQQAYRNTDKTSATLNASDMVEYKNASLLGSVKIIRAETDTTVYYVSDTEYKFKDAIAAANECLAKNVIVHVRPGTYDLISEYGTTYLDENEEVGPYIRRDMTIYFDGGSKVIAHYTGSNQYINQHFSILTVQRYSLTLINATLEASNIRYCVHDEHGANEEKYKSEYINCKMAIDNTDNVPWSTANCLGVGLGKNAYFVVNGGHYASTRRNDEREVDNVDIRIHNSSAANAQSRVVISNVYCKKGVGAFSYGSSELMTDFFVSNCSFLRDVYEGFSTGATIDNMNVVKWCNEIR